MVLKKQDFFSAFAFGMFQTHPPTHPRTTNMPKVCPYAMALSLVDFQASYMCLFYCFVARSASKSNGRASARAVMLG